MPHRALSLARARLWRCRSPRNRRVEQSLLGSVTVRCLPAALLLWGTACSAAAEQAPRLTSETFNVRAGESSLQAARRLAERLRPQLARQVGGSETIAFGSDQIGPQGERLIITATTPKGGAFAVISLEALRGATGTVPVCRFELVWPDPNAERSAAGLQWALRSLPDAGCRTAQQGSTDWERKSAAFRRTVTAQRAGITIVSIDQGANLSFPPDLRAAMQAALRQGERLERVAPLPQFHDARAVGWTSKGRVLLAVPDNSPHNVCVVEATGWSNLARQASPVTQTLARSCHPLLSEVKAAWSKRMEQSLKQHPITISPVR